MLLEVELTAHQALVLGKTPASTAPVDTKRYVPGSVLRGALGTAWIRDHGLPLEAPEFLRRQFVELFEHTVVPGPLFAGSSQVVPLSVRRCKYRKCPGSHVDLAFHQDEHLPHCQCGGPLAGGRGEVEFFDEGPTPIRQRTHLEIDDATQVAAEGQLFTRRALAPRTARNTELRFRGHLSVPDDLPEDVREGLLSWLLTTRKLRLGAQLSTNGQVTYSASHASSEPPETAERLALRLHTPTVLTDSSGIPLDLTDRVATCQALDAELFPLLNTHLTAVERVWLRHERIGGWHAASSLPKSVELAVSAGSVFVLRFETAPEPAALLRLTGHGLGLRRNEGFGAVEVGTRAWQPPLASAAGTAPADAAADADPGEERPQFAVASAQLPYASAEFYARLLYATRHSAWFLHTLRTFFTKWDETGVRPEDEDLLNRRIPQRAPREVDRRWVLRLFQEESSEVFEATYAYLTALHRLLPPSDPVEEAAE